MATFSRLIMLCALALSACGAGEKGARPLQNSLSMGLVNPTGQQVTESTDCASAWKELKTQLDREGKGDQVPIQEQYVDRFLTLEDRNAEEINAYDAIAFQFPRLRESLVWPCWDEDMNGWRERMKNAIARVMERGYLAEITLYHHDSYPAKYHDPDPHFGIPKSGWANADILAGWRDYVESVANAFAGTLPPGSVVYIVQEPIPMLVKSYLGKGIEGGPWPPNGNRADASFASAMRNMYTAIQVASLIIKNRGWKPAIAQNIRLAEATGPDAERLNYIYNWWLLDALVDGCVDNDFDGACEQSRPPSAIAVVGVTFYGTMSMTDEVVSLAAQDAPGVDVRFGEPSWRADAAAFKAALLAVHARYPDMPVAVAEIGLSEGDLATQGTLLRQYRDVVLELNYAGAVAGSIELHSMFRNAEFRRGPWKFEIVGNCADPISCEITPWGMIAKEIADGR